jgi:hypothetical protein
MGGIDLDPASSAEAQKTIKAKKFFSAADDGRSPSPGLASRVEEVKDIRDKAVAMTGRQPLRECRGSDPGFPA